MRITLLSALLVSLTLSGCGWFGGNRGDSSASGTGDAANPLIPTSESIFDRPEGPDVSVPIGTITQLRVEPTPSGAIIYATGVADRQGAFRARLVPDNEDLEPVDGVLGFILRVNYPADPTPVGSELSRTIHEAFTVTSQTLSNVRSIRVAGERNAQEVRRR